MVFLRDGNSTLLVAHQERNRQLIKSAMEYAAGFEGRYVVVTGARGGIGLATAQAFARLGANVIAVDRTAEAAKDAADRLSQVGPRGTHTPIDIDFEDVAAITAGMGQLRAVTRDVLALVNVAGFAEDALVHMLSQQSLKRQMQVNFDAQVQITQYVTRMMLRTGGGSVVNVSSVTALDGNPGQLAYAASKAAVLSATRTFSMALAPKGIRVNAVAPGVINTPMTQALDESARARLLGRVSLGRLGTPDEVASCILWLCSPAASYVTGQVLRIDGCM